MRIQLIWLVFLTLSLNAQNVKLSDKSEIAVMTLGPYQPELYSAFGHSAIRVYDPAKNIDWIYNYGVFDFQQKNFYLNFAKGTMIYQLGMARYEPFKNGYVREDRDVKLQYLNLTRDQKQALFEVLQKNYKPANREYMYNYVYDNCASKIPEVIEGIFPQINYDTSYVQQDKTIRDLMHDYLDYQPWGEWMIDIGLGMQIDKQATAKEYMFLPDYVYQAFSEATIGHDKPLVSRSVTVYKKKHANEENGFLTPMNVFILLFFIGGFLTHLDMKKNKRTKWLDALLFGFAGFVGIWLVFLWFGTAHLSKWNLDILWAIPFHFVVMVLFGWKKFNVFVRYYFKGVAFFYGILLLSWAILPEPLHMALVPFVLLLLLRSAYISYYLKRFHS